MNMFLHREFTSNTEHFAALEIKRFTFAQCWIQEKLLTDLIGLVDSKFNEPIKILTGPTKVV